MPPVTNPEKQPLTDSRGAFARARRRPAKTACWATALFVFAALTAGCSGRRQGSDSVPTIQWEACPSDYPSNLTCGKLWVPMDHERGDRRQIQLGMIRSQATASKPLGNLIINPGGPGSSIVKIFVDGRQREVVGPRLLEQYHVIGPDPRGVGISSPIRCDASLYNRRVPSYMTSQADVDARMAWNRALGRSCVDKTGPLIRHVDTISAAIDLEYIRKALGDEKLNFMGISYGTQLGSQYAELYPERVGKMVLDGVVDHTQRNIDSLMTEAVAYEDSVKGFFRWCNTTTDCAFHGKDLSSIFDKLIDDAIAKPIPALSCAENSTTDACASAVTGYQLISNAQDSISEPEKWPNLSLNLLQALRGNATSLSPSLAMKETDSSFSHTAISCLDWEREKTGSGLVRALMAARALTPHTRGVSETLDIQTSCMGWPVPVKNPPRRLRREQLAKAPTILLVSGLHDPSTSVTWAVGLREQMPTAVSVFRDGFGHTSYWDYGETQRAVDGFLIEGELPADLTVFKT
ncbi:tripeptidyl aminopeptidase [Ophiocordyceps camponoti-floridani]|uniref:Tripeptidyl aminopeptidase n=1 Tax=Ophiocordyceps camponoti-floridani TaxID=2030778 RepID=A0A8H4Q8V4_9HYPO|nr:tripeptidyl aminopeptidase [Ophiocordyceps camponoti-floridani]